MKPMKGLRFNLSRIISWWQFCSLQHVRLQLRHHPPTLNIIRRCKMPIMFRRARRSSVRYGPELNEKSLATLTFTVTGSKSGPHAGQTILADDQKTVIFKPAVRFTPGEQVKVDTSRPVFERTTHI